MTVVNYSAFVYIAIAYMILVAIIYVIYRAIQKKRAEKININQKLNSRGRNKFYFLYRLFKVIPFVNKLFNKVIKNTEAVYPADQMSINKEATKTMMKSMGISGAAILATLFLAKGDLWFLLMGIMAAVVIFHLNITATFQKMELILLEQMVLFLSVIRHHYRSSYIVEDAVEDTLDEIPYEIGLHIAKIHEILISPIMDEKTEEYTSTAPNRFMLLLLSICTSSKEYGNGDDAFLDSLSHLKEEVNAELLNQRKIKDAYAFLTGICLSVVFLLKPCEAWATSNMKELNAFYTGMGGKAFMVGIFIIAFVCYYLIEALRETKRGEIVQYNIWSKIASLPYISVVLNKTVNKNYLKARRLNENMKEIGDHTGPKAFLVKQCSFALIAFIFFNCAVLVNTVQEKLTMLSEYVVEFDSNIVPNKKYREVMQQTSKEYVELMKDVKNPDTEQIKQQLMQNGKVRNETYALMVAEEVTKKLNEYQNTYFKWYTLLLAIGAAWIAYQCPMWYLKFKCKLSTQNKEEEVGQFQTLILILMNADGIRMDTILEWLSKFAYSFKATIDDCIIELESGERKALEKMKMSEDNQSFQMFVDCLISTDETDIKSAFSEILIDREHSLKERERKNNKMLEQRSGTAKVLAFAPLMILLFGYLAGPMIVLAAKMFFSMDMSI
ncbi:MAG: hypothetical protein UHN47_03890 [Lachnospiraceae bacterium]|nr:hypothetical protein [Lachnospiraceae bacterium]